MRPFQRSSPMALCCLREAMKVCDVLHRHKLCCKAVWCTFLVSCCPTPTLQRWAALCSSVIRFSDRVRRVVCTHNVLRDWAPHSSSPLCSLPDPRPRQGTRPHTPTNHPDCIFPILPFHCPRPPYAPSCQTRLRTSRNSTYYA